MVRIHGGFCQYNVLCSVIQNNKMATPFCIQIDSRLNGVLFSKSHPHLTLAIQYPALATCFCFCYGLFTDIQCWACGSDFRKSANPLISGPPISLRICRLSEVRLRFAICDFAIACFLADFGLPQIRKLFFKIYSIIYRFYTLFIVIIL